MQGIYTYILETNYVPREYSVAAILLSLFVVLIIIIIMGRDSSVGIATRYRLDSPEIESRWGEIFRTCPDRPWDPLSLLYNGYRVSAPGVKRPGRGVDQLPHLAPRLK